MIYYPSLLYVSSSVSAGFSYCPFLSSPVLSCGFLSKLNCFISSCLLRCIILLVSWLKGSLSMSFNNSYNIFWVEIVLKPRTFHPLKLYFFYLLINARCFMAKRAILFVYIFKLLRHLIYLFILLLYYVLLSLYRVWNKSKEPSAHSVFALS